VSVGTLKQQLLQELKKSWQKTALLTLLFAVGLFFWIPPLLRSVRADHTGGNAGTGTASASEVMRPDREPPPVAAEAVPARPAAAYSWEQVAAALESDPLVRSVEVAAIQGDPFRIDFDQFSPPILFEEDPRDVSEPLLRGKKPEATARVLDASPQLVKAPPGLVLKSTIVGLKRRAALINSKLYYEGKDIYVDGEVYRLTAIAPRKVILSRGQEQFELEIARAPEAGGPAVPLAELSEQP
jgi:hypothetical protein